MWLGWGAQKSKPFFFLECTSHDPPPCCGALDGEPYPECKKKSTVSGCLNDDLDT